MGAVGDDLDASLSDAAAALWRTYLGYLPSGHPHRAARVTAFSFGDSPGLADELAALVVSRRKRATASLPIQFEAEGTALAAAGDVSIVTRADGTPLATSAPSSSASLAESPNENAVTRATRWG